MPTVLFNKNQILVRVFLNRECLRDQLLKNSWEAKLLYLGTKNGDAAMKNGFEKILNDISSIRKKRYLENIKESLSRFNNLPNHNNKERRPLNDNLIFERQIFFSEGENKKFQRKINGLKRRHRKILEFSILTQ